MKSLIICYLLLALNFAVFSQSYRYTHGAENGYVWITLETSPNPLTDYKYQYLATMLDNQRYLITYQNKPKLPIGCFHDINKLGESKYAEQFDLDFMVKMIDDFYYEKENMIIPIIGAYCYSIKNLAGVDKKELENYRRELLAFSKEGLE